MADLLVVSGERHLDKAIAVAEASGAARATVQYYSGVDWGAVQAPVVVLVYPSEADDAVVPAAHAQAAVVVVERPQEQMAHLYLGACVEEVVFDDELGTLPRAIGRAGARRAATAQLAKAARVDPLTELLNRRGIEELLPRIAARGDGAVAVLLDLDGFKEVNTRLGHAGGDALLRHTAEHLRASTRPTDLVCRYGGDEFMIVMPGVDMEAAVALAERVRATLAASGVSASLGLADARGVATVDGLVKRTQACLAEGKRAGKNCCVYRNRAGDVVIAGVAGH